MEENLSRSQLGVYSIDLALIFILFNNMDSIITDITNQLNTLCDKYRSLQDYFSKNDSTILNDLEYTVAKHHRYYNIEDVCDTDFKERQNIDLLMIYAFIQHMKDTTGFYEFLQMYQLDFPRYEALREKAYQYYYNHPGILTQYERTNIDWNKVKEYLDKNQMPITDFFKPV
jgi:hypothetical protein